MTDHTETIKTIQALRAQLDTLEAQLRGVKPASKPSAAAVPKPKRVASDALKAWNAFVDEVKADMASSAWVHPETGKPVTRRDAMVEASKRRAADPNAPKPKPKPVKAEVEVDANGDAKPKPKRVLSDDQKAKMAAGRKAAAERRKAEKAAADLPPLPPSDDDAGDTLSPLNIKGRKFLYDPESNGCWKRNTDGSKGDWAGAYDPDTKTIDDSVEEP